MGMPTSSVIENAASVSSSVALPFSTMIDLTERLSVTDSPRSRVTTCPRYSTYWSAIGRS